MPNDTVLLGTGLKSVGQYETSAVRHCSVLNSKVAAVLKSTVRSSAAYTKVRPMYCFIIGFWKIKQMRLI